jgi:hypothetical protein
MQLTNPLRIKDFALIWSELGEWGGGGLGYVKRLFHSYFVITASCAGRRVLEERGCIFNQPFSVYEYIALGIPLMILATLNVNGPDS